MIGQTRSHCKITAALGVGRRGEVYSGTDTSLDDPAELKFLSGDAARRGLGTPPLREIGSATDPGNRWSPTLALEHVSPR